MKNLRPPRGTMRLDGVDVTGLTRAPDGRWYVTRQSAPTVLVPAEDLPARIEVA